MPPHSWPAVEAPSTLDPAAAALPAVDDALLAAAVAAAPLAAVAVAVVYVLGLLLLPDNPCEILNKIEFLH